MSTTSEEDKGEGGGDGDGESTPEDESDGAESFGRATPNAKRVIDWGKRISFVKTSCAINWGGEQAVTSGIEVLPT